MTKVLEVNFQDVTEVEQAIEINKELENKEKFLIRSTNDSLVSKECVLLLVRKRYKILSCYNDLTFKFDY